MLMKALDVRENLKGQEYSFTEIAKTVGERWHVLPPEEKAKGIILACQAKSVGNLVVEA